jgi:hypothetical protein
MEERCRTDRLPVYFARQNRRVKLLRRRRLKVGRFPGARRIGQSPGPIHDFGIADWVRGLFDQSVALYAQNRRHEARLLQTGLAWQGLKECIRGSSELQMVELLGKMLRYANSDKSEASRLFFRAYIPLSLEHDAFGEYIGTDTLGRLTDPRHGLVLVRRTLRRWCDWMESLAHLKAHKFGPRNLRLRFGADAALIRLWPLVGRHRWSYGNLLQVIGMILHRPATSFCASEAELAAHVRALGLGTITRGGTNGVMPTGVSIALRYSHFWTI